MTREQLFYDATDLGIIVVLLFVWSLAFVGLYTVIRVSIEWVLTDIHGRWFKRRARRRYVRT